MPIPFSLRWRGLTKILAVLCLVTPATQALALVGLTNPAAAHCIDRGGFYGMRDGANGTQGMCLLPSGEEVDAWTYFRDTMFQQNQTARPEIANPAATYCIAVGGTYDISSSICTQSDGTQIDAWRLLGGAQPASTSLANPAATHCIESSGAYEIRDSAQGKVGMCRLPDGSEQDAWALYHQDK